MIRRLIGAIGFCVIATHALAEPLEIVIGYLGHAGVKSTLSLAEQPAEDNGVAGVRLAIEDDNTTGKFLNQHFTLDEARVKNGADIVKAATALADHDGFIEPNEMRAAQASMMKRRQQASQQPAPGASPPMPAAPAAEKTGGGQ